MLRVGNINIPVKIADFARKFLSDLEICEIVDEIKPEQIYTFVALKRKLKVPNKKIKFSKNPKSYKNNKKNNYIKIIY